MDVLDAQGFRGKKPVEPVLSFFMLNYSYMSETFRPSPAPPEVARKEQVPPPEQERMYERRDSLSLSKPFFETAWKFLNQQCALFDAMGVKTFEQFQTRVTQGRVSEEIQTEVTLLRADLERLFKTGEFPKAFLERIDQKAVEKEMGVYFDADRALQSQPSSRNRALLRVVYTFVKKGQIQDARETAEYLDDLGLYKKAMEAVVDFEQQKINDSGMAKLIDYPTLGPKSRLDIAANTIKRSVTSSPTDQRLFDELQDPLLETMSRVHMARALLLQPRRKRVEEAVQIVDRIPFAFVRDLANASLAVQIKKKIDDQENPFFSRVSSGFARSEINRENVLLRLHAGQFLQVAQELPRIENVWLRFQTALECMRECATLGCDTELFWLIAQKALVELHGSHRESLVVIEQMVAELVIDIAKAGAFDEAVGFSHYVVDPSRHEQVLLELAKTVRSMGETEQAKKIISKIETPTVRAQALLAIGVIEAERGLPPLSAQEALKTVKKIESPVGRARVLSELAIRAETVGFSNRTKRKLLNDLQALVEQEKDPTNQKKLQREYVHALQNDGELERAFDIIAQTADFDEKDALLEMVMDSALAIEDMQTVVRAHAQITNAERKASASLRLMRLYVSRREAASARHLIPLLEQSVYGPEALGILATMEIEEDKKLAGPQIIYKLVVGDDGGAVVDEQRLKIEKNYAQRKRLLASHGVASVEELVALSKNGLVADDALKTVHELDRIRGDLFEENRQGTQGTNEQIRENYLSELRRELSKVGRKEDDRFSPWPYRAVLIENGVLIPPDVFTLRNYFDQAHFFSQDDREHLEAFFHAYLELNNSDYLETIAEACTKGRFKNKLDMWNRLPQTEFRRVVEALWKNGRRKAALRYAEYDPVLFARFAVLEAAEERPTHALMARAETSILSSSKHEANSLQDVQNWLDIAHARWEVHMDPGDAIASARNIFDKFDKYGSRESVESVVSLILGTYIPILLRLDRQEEAETLAHRLMSNKELRKRTDLFKYEVWTTIAELFPSHTTTAKSVRAKILSFPLGNLDLSLRQRLVALKPRLKKVFLERAMIMDLSEPYMQQLIVSDPTFRKIFDQLSYGHAFDMNFQGEMYARLGKPEKADKSVDEIYLAAGTAFYHIDRDELDLADKTYQSNYERKFKLFEPIKRQLNQAHMKHVDRLLRQMRKEGQPVLTKEDLVLE